ncbi:hypothetical protein SMICM304S_11180 [Streptomyces microflavus]
MSLRVTSTWPNSEAASWVRNGKPLIEISVVPALPPLILTRSSASDSAKWSGQPVGGDEEAADHRPAGPAGFAVRACVWFPHLGRTVMGTPAG